MDLQDKKEDQGSDNFFGLKMRLYSKCSAPKMNTAKLLPIKFIRDPISYPVNP